ncbi:MAG: STAS domain-containing protein [Hyphomonadaceae bacterium]
MRLPAILDLGAATPLWTEICAQRGQPLQLDASGVERLGGICLQVLLSAHAQWRADGMEFSVINASSAFSEALGLMAASELGPVEASL